MLVEEYLQEEVCRYMVIQESNHGAYILQLSGALDFKARVVFQDAIKKGQDSGHKCIILDFQNVPFIDSSALGLLSLAADALKKEAIALRLVRPQEAVRKILDLVNIKNTIPIFSNIDDAVSS
jgi:anti-anti-sigma factor